MTKLRILSASALTSFLSCAALADEQSEIVDAKAERAQRQAQELMLKSANAIDNFFSNTRHSWGDNKTRVTLRGNTDWIDGADWEFNGEVRINLVLPGMNDRLRVIANEDDDDGATGGQSDEDESTLGLRFVGNWSKKHGIAFDLGVSSYGDPSLQGFARMNLFRAYGLGQSSWLGRTENRLFYYFESEWRNDFRQYFERPISDKFFFRSRTRFDYQKDKGDNIYTEQKFTLFHTFNPKTAIAYEAIYREQFFEDSPFFPDNLLVQDEVYSRFLAQIRFRRNFKFPWLYYEVWPIAAFAEERDYEFTPAFRFRVEVILGDPPTKARLDE